MHDSRPSMSTSIIRRRVQVSRSRRKCRSSQACGSPDHANVWGPPLGVGTTKGRQGPDLTGPGPFGAGESAVHPIDLRAEYIDPDVCVDILLHLVGRLGR